MQEKKKKFRLRWYGSPFILNNPTLEIKYKNAFIVKKSNYKFFKLNGINLLNNKNLDLIKDEVNKKINLKKIIYPVLTTNYDRQYLISNNKKVRATVDYNLQSIHLKNLSQLDMIKNFSKICIL